MIYIMTHAGEGKEISEDAVLVGRQLFSDTTDISDVPDDGFVCVADGVGGNSAGEEAAAFVLNALTNSGWDDDSVLREKLMKINRQLIAQSTEDPSRRNMATTLSGICVKGEELKLLHIGNTRIYVMQGHYLKQLTSDHTVYNWLKSLGRSDEAEACNKNEITSCLHEYVSIDDLEDILNSDIPNSEKCTAIREAALLAGSMDDMTAVLICLREKEIIKQG